MPLPAAARILDLHDALASAGPAQRALLLLEAGVALTPSAAAAMPLGTVDAGLLGVYASWFGQQLVAEARCPHCAAALDVALDLAALGGAGVAAAGERCVTRGEISAVVRPLTLADLAAAEGLPLADAQAQLLRSGIVAVARRGSACDLATLSAESQAWLGDALAVADPQADLAVSLACGGCTTVWDERLDLCAFIVARLAALATRLVGEVHALAVAYGWSEAAILALPSHRRRTYRAMAAG